MYVSFTITGNLLVPRICVLIADDAFKPRLAPEMFVGLFALMLSAPLCAALLRNISVLTKIRNGVKGARRSLGMFCVFA